MGLSISRAAIALGAVALLAAGSLPAAAATEEEFLNACIEAAGADSTELCTCKAEQAATLVDPEMMDYIIERMSDPLAFNARIAAGEIPEEVLVRWPYYVRDSNAVCLAPDAAS